MHWTMFAKSIKIFNHNLDFKKTNVHGQRPNTRAQAFLHTLTKDKISGAEKYRSERKALLTLGLPETDQTSRTISCGLKIVVGLPASAIHAKKILGSGTLESKWFD